MTRRYRIVHHTSYGYDQDVTDSYGMTRCRPRDMPGQRCLEHEVWTDPVQADLGTHMDGERNVLSYFHVTTPHRRLVVSSVSVVECATPARDPAAETLAWEDARPGSRRDAPDSWQALDYVAASPRVRLEAEATAYAAESLRPGRPLVEAVLDLTHRLHTDFEYDPGSTTVTSTVADVLGSRRGVCQDFAHLAVACLRGHGLAARYVSGYLATDPPPGRPRMVGADATHAWVQCWVPGYEWIALDPTNDCEAGDRHITVAWGRDYGDVPPVKGVIFTEARSSSMKVAVDVAPLEYP